MTSDWEPMDTLPEVLRDGREVYVKRVYGGRIVKEGSAVFALPHAAAPMRSGPGVDPLGRLSAADYARENEARGTMVAASMWLNPDRMYKFPEPTHWSPSRSGCSNSPDAPLGT